MDNITFIIHHRLDSNIINQVPGTSGLYRCEVSAEGTFETDSREINITILGMPCQ